MYLDSELDIVGVSSDIETITPMHGAHPTHGQVVALFATQADLAFDDNDVVAEITFMAQSSGFLSDMIGLSAMQNSQWINDDLEIGVLELEFVSEVKDLSITAYPNPASTNTTFMIQSPDDYPQGRLNIYDISGKQIQSISVSISKGENTMSWNKSEVGYEAGMLLYELQAGQSILKGKLMIVE